MPDFNPFRGNEPSDDDGPPMSKFIPSTDEVKAHAGRSNFNFWLVQEYDAAEQEQLDEHRRRGELEARPYDEIAGRLNHDAQRARQVSDQQTKLATRSQQRYDQAHDDLWRYVRRPNDAKWMKYLRWGLLVGGDAAGVTGAALLLGEQFTTAFLQATSIGAAVVCLGAVGRDLRFMTTARARHIKEVEK